jgi:hypothetical protein
MFKLSRFQLLFSPADDLGGGDDNTPAPGPPGNDKEDIIKFLGDDDEKPKEDDIDLSEKKDKKESKSKSADEKAEKDTSKDDESDDEDEEKDDDEEEDDELEALLDETEEPDEEKLELVTPVRRREILKKYPELFKDFPYLEKAYYREQQYTELLPTIEDAKNAVEKGKAFDTFEQDLMSGNVETLLKTIKGGNQNSFYKIIDELMPTLARVDNDAYTHVLGNMVKHTIVSMIGEARRSKNETLESAAVILNQYVFGNSEFQPPTRLSKEVKPDEKASKLDEREKAIVRQQFDTASGDLNTRVNNAIKNAIEGNIDPRSSMTDYVKKTAVREANEALTTLIEKDSRFKTIVDKLWENAFKNNFSKDSVDRIKSAYLSKAKTLLPSVIKKARNDALKGIGKRVREDNDKEDRNKPRSQRERNSGKKDDKSSGVPRGMSTLDFLSQD